MIWLLVIALSVAFPINALEAAQEVEVLEEVKLYLQIRADQVQKPTKLKLRLQKFSPENEFENEYDSYELTSKKYLVNCNLIFYDWLN